MKRDWYDFKALHSNFPGARDAFEKACETLFRKMHSEKNVQQVTVKRGDGGIDVYVGELGIEPVVVYQCKFFLDELKDSQYTQIKNSFERAITSSDYKMSNWMLCLPRVLNYEENLKWSEWKANQMSKYELSSTFIALKNGNELIDLMEAQDVYSQIFNIEELNLAKDTNRKVTQLVKAFDPQRSSLPKILWSTYIGKQKWKNTPLIIGDNIFVGSAGDQWNEADNNDGVYCLELYSGAIKWFYPTKSDVNEINIYDGNIIGGCDSGLVFCISAKTGKEKWIRELASGVVSKVLKDVGLSTEKYIVITYSGEVHFLDTVSGTTLYVIELHQQVMANATYVKQNHETQIFIPSVKGLVFLLVSTFDHFQLKQTIGIGYPDQFSPTGLTFPQLYSPPLIDNGLMYLAVARQTYYGYPAIGCFDWLTGDTLWFASDSDGIGTHFGNIRTNLVIYGDEIIFTHPYSNEVGGIDKKSGKLNWLTKIGRAMFQQWSSPVIYQDHIYLGRYDGYLYKVNGKSKEREWGIYLGENDDAGVVYDKDQPISNENEHAAWELYKGKSLLSTPAILRGLMIVGSDEGYLYAIGNI
ncbi:outer membrane protein assembly factor BamB [Filimonas zeae]|uniref:Pyrrolo-quinoline quinone repeat domain-containing protein n=1 Tax=Filimonas zeae TaxID=1737353 RepID=A0A917IR50_9BACT|nr:PQQ-binding-like beta-propeller repeat protein [Filimonas zeae]MDR6338146.1 outer membrane protein assembly factor BamB [Filimonas zeae]GGH61943.1 hypothetical protein GCM10011379_11420 [Filimonas zeae]